MADSTPGASGFRPTHVLSWQDGRELKTKLVLWDPGDNLLDEGEWLDGSPSDWCVFAGELLFWGEKYEGPGRKAWVRPIPEPPLPVERALDCVRRGLRSLESIVVALGEEPGRVERALKTLERGHLVDVGERDGSRVYRPAYEGNAGGARRPRARDPSAPR